MAVRREDTAPNLKDFQIGCSWVPTTPAKPNPSKEQLICTNWQQNHSIQANWLESERYTAANLVTQANLSESGILQQDFLQGTQSQTAPACCSSTNLINLSRDYNTWQASEVTNARVCGDNYWANMSFQKLLALAHARGNKAAVQNGVTKTDVAASSNSALRFHPQIERGQFMISFANPSVQELESLRGAKSEIELNRPNVFTDGSSIPSGPFFHLNSPTREIMYADSSKSTPPQFQPITPEKNNEAVYGQEPGRRVLSIDRATAGEDAQEDKLTKYGSVELPENEEKSQLTIAATSTQLQENHKPDKGGIEEVDLSQTPQQKPRRKKHRPKVIIEGQHKRTPKSSVDKPTVPQETTRVKRKYVRRKGVNSHLEGQTDGTDSNKKGPSPMDSSVSKRKYVRKGINKPQSNTDSGATETSDAMPPQRTRSSCRRSLNFNSEGQVKDESSSNHPSSNCNKELQAEDFIAKDQSQGNEQCGMEKSDKGIYDQCTHSMKKVWEECMESPEQHFRSPAPSTTVYQLQDNHMFTDQVVCTRGKCQIIFSDLTHDKEANTAQIRMNPGDQRAPNNLCDSINHTCLAPERQERVLKRQKMATTVEPELCNQNETGTTYNSLQKYLQIFSQNVDKNGSTPGLNFPAIYKKKRSEVVHSIVPSSLQHTTSAIDSHMKFERHTPRDSCTNLFTSTHVTDGAQNGRQIFEALLALGPTEKIKKRRSKGPTRLRDLASLVEICKELPASPGRVATTSRNEQGIEILHEPHTCIEALVADTRSTVTTKKRSKRSMLVSSTVQFNQQKSSSISIGPPLALTWKCISPIDSITEQLNQLDLNAKSSQRLAQKQNTLVAYHKYYQEQQALVPFQGGAVVAFDGSFDQVRRRRPRPKVDLDDETTRVWKLLLENINSEGIDGTDEQKTKWWEEERRVFNGRADSFIARMHLVQGDRRFSPWKGSVVDSVVGVFLTQNVSDHLSSSAFMSLAARFPAESRNRPVDLYEERLGTNMKEPEVREMDPDGTFGLNKEIFNLSVYGENIKKHQDFKDDSIREVNSVNSSRNSFDVFISEESLTGQVADFSEIGPVMPRETVTNKLVSLVEDGKDTEDTLSSQNSADSPLAQTTERSDSCLPNTSEEPITQPQPGRFTSTTSFVKLLQMAGTVLHGVYDKSNDERASDQNRRGQSESMAINLQNEGHLDYATFTAKPTSSYVSNLGGLKTECNLPHKTSKIFNSSSEKEPYGAEISGLISESASQTTFQEITAVSFQEGPNFSGPNAQLTNNDQTEINRMGQVPAVSSYQENNIIMQELNPIYPGNMDIVGISSNIDNSKSSEHKEVNSNKVDPDCPTGKKIDRLKAKGVRSRKEKEKQVDWDHLRKQACVGGREKAKAANMMNSVDWDAVRCADVNEIAQTIKERGMNNMLAERIKDFLNRLVREHGSVDLEWLRDVPPDKAKEYLLSIRGLGLKSVECVRLLTLHHLAFPVDTNVGRIAVRLGWVPLQPLPESLQLHLLELYPVLESIQKYLWPRLCKLDQRTLYELHYQMITFGKVFCTKSKPNCNACPMRGECRHFASAFASARLALPAPEEKSIVIAPEKREADQYTMRSMNNLQLPPPHTNQMDSKSGVSNSQPIIEEPATPEAIIEAPATPEPTYTQISECDIESTFNEEPDEIPTIKLNMEEFTNNLQKIIEQSNELQESDMSKALVALTSEAASIPVPKLKNVSRLRTEHQVYELPDSHPLLEGMDKREPDDPCPYLLAIWTPGETVDSIEPPERQCSSQGSEKLCPSETCSSCNSIREANSQTVRGTLLIPCRTAMRGSFPLNGTYFQVNEVFSDHESSLSPMDVPRGWLWKLPRRTVYFGTSIPTIFKGLSTEGIQYCFWRGFVCVRGFDRKTRAPRPLAARLHFPTSKLSKGERKDR